MRYLLDTNACIRFLTERSSSVVARVQSTSPRELALCSIVKTELVYGARKSARARANLEALDRFFAPFVSIPFDDQAAQTAGELRATLERQGTPIGPNDLLIAATAVANHLTLVTHNVKEFGRVAELSTEDWEEE